MWNGINCTRREMVTPRTGVLHVSLDFYAISFFLVCYDGALVRSPSPLSSFYLALILILDLLLPLQHHKLFILRWPLFLRGCSRFAELNSSWIRIQSELFNPVHLKITFQILAELKLRFFFIPKDYNKQVVLWSESGDD